MPDDIKWPAALAGEWVIDRVDALLGSSTAVFSRDRCYRYALTRSWGPGPWAAWVMVNPSSAGAGRNDQTISRCVLRTRSWGGFGGLVVVNEHAYIATDPDDLDDAADPVGPANDLFIKTAVAASERVVVAWGVDGARAGRDREVLGMLAGRPVYCLGTTAKGHPKHPLYVPGATPIEPYQAREAA